MTTVAYENSLMPSDGPGNTVYDPGFPINSASYHNTDMAIERSNPPSDFVQWSEIDYELGGNAGLVDRNAYVLGGIDNYSDAHDFRGDHVTLKPRDAGGNYGDVGNSDDASNYYSAGIAAQSYPDVTREESWDSISGGF
jgi:hypothetical protein